jgi:hypothetical protein
MPFIVGDERRVCRPGEIVFVPAGVEHGFVAETETVLDIFSEQRMGLYVIVLEPGGARRVEEVFIEGFPSSRPRLMIEVRFAESRDFPAVASLVQEAHALHAQALPGVFQSPKAMVAR